MSGAFRCLQNWALDLVDVFEYSCTSISDNRSFLSKVFTNNVIHLRFETARRRKIWNPKPNARWTAAAKRCWQCRLSRPKRSAYSSTLGIQLKLFWLKFPSPFFCWHECNPHFLTSCVYFTMSCIILIIIFVYFKFL